MLHCFRSVAEGIDTTITAPTPRTCETRRVRAVHAERVKRALASGVWTLIGRGGLLRRCYEQHGTRARANQKGTTHDEHLSLWHVFTLEWRCFTVPSGCPKSVRLCLGEMALSVAGSEATLARFHSVATDPVEFCARPRFDQIRPRIADII